MLGSSASISFTNTVINTIVAEELRQFADELENADNFEASLHELIKRTVTDHKRIIFNGDGYDDAWVKEASRRGLHNLPTTPDAISHMLDDRNVELFAKNKVFTKTELASRRDIAFENYCKIIHIEALTMIDMARNDILPAVSKYSAEIARNAREKLEFLPNFDCSYERETLEKLSELSSRAYKVLKQLETDLEDANSVDDFGELAMIYKDKICVDMDALREPIDEIELLSSSEYRPYPSYGELLFGIR